MNCHSFCRGINKRIYKLSSSFSIFNSYNTKKLSRFMFRRYEFRCLPKYISLYVKQRGLCFICKKSFLLKRFKILILKDSKSNFVKSLVIAHVYCNFLLLIFLLFRNLFH